MSTKHKKSDAPGLNIQSYIRVRPLSLREKKSLHLEIGKRDVSVRSSADTGKPSKIYTFDRVFAEDSKQVSVYSTIVKPMIKEVIQGYNCTVFAYGQTGTGKTYTMSGNQSDSNASWEDNSHAGIIPRAVEDIFTELSGQTCEHQVSVSFIELYNEKLRSLLNDFNEDTNIKLIDDMEGGVILKGLSATPVKNRDEALQLLQRGAERKQVASTQMNQNSSRSHTIFTISVNIKESVLDKDDVLRVGKLYLVDLAGSENVSKSGASDKLNKNATGVNRRLAEASNINKSLLTLGRVITSLTEHNPHIPYRESKLTRLLRDSLGGRTKTCIIGTISPCHANMDETESTLNYAYKARSIKNKPEKNQTISKKEFMQVASEEILKLKRDLEAVRQGDGFYISKESHEEMTAHMNQLDSQVKDWYERYNTIHASFEEHKELFSSLRDDYDDKCAEYEELEKIFQNECEKFTKNLADIQKEIVVREYFIQEYRKTEKNLTDQAKQFKSVVENVLEQNCSLHDKICKKEKNQNSNIKALEGYKGSVMEKLGTLETWITKRYKKEQECFSHIMNTTGNIYDQISQHCITVKSQLKECNDAAQKHALQLHALNNKMVEEFQKNIEENCSPLKEFVAIYQNTLSSMATRLTEDTLRMEQKVESTIACVTDLHLGLKTETAGVMDDFEAFKQILRETSEIIINSYDQVNCKINNTVEVSNETKLKTSAALTEVNEMRQRALKLAQDMESLQTIIKQSCEKAETCHDMMQEVADKSCTSAQVVCKQVQECNTVHLDLDKKLTNTWAFLESCQNITAPKLTNELHDLNTETLCLKTNSIQDISSMQLSVETQSHNVNESEKAAIQLVQRTKEDLDRISEEGLQDVQRVLMEGIADTKCWEDSIEKTLRENQHYMKQHCKELKQHEELTSERLETIKTSTQDIRYSVYCPRGTTPKRIKIKDLNCPEDLASTASPECLVNKLNEDPLFEENLQPIHWANFLNRPQEKADSQLSGTNSLTAEIVQPDNVHRLRRSSSLPDINRTLIIPDENKENAASATICLTKKELPVKSALSKTIKLVLCDRINSPQFKA